MYQPGKKERKTGPPHPIRAEDSIRKPEEKKTEMGERKETMADLASSLSDITSQVPQTIAAPIDPSPPSSAVHSQHESSDTQLTNK
ncbi:Golgin subfamily A member 4 [Corchorus capsularis]|uniref:Golgin subfamily A member 4 n=1 Tax=Corchorus capsularis TaxID=210143 RepID=A0A1R3FWJ7_COCAP|nr:Golgin subfamily A member 4 [Corchorus capsularis]